MVSNLILIRQFSPDFSPEVRRINRGRGFQLSECDRIEQGFCIYSTESFTPSKRKGEEEWSPYGAREIEISKQKFYRCGTGMKSFWLNLEPGQSQTFLLPVKVESPKKGVLSHISPTSVGKIQAVKEGERWIRFGKNQYLPLPASGLEVMVVLAAERDLRANAPDNLPDYSVKDWSCSLPLRLEPI